MGDAYLRPHVVLGMYVNPEYIVTITSCLLVLNYKEAKMKKQFPTDQEYSDVTRWLIVTFHTPRDSARIYGIDNRRNRTIITLPDMKEP